MESLKVGRDVSGVRWFSISLSLLVYLSFVIYSEWHFYNLISEFVPADFALIGLVAVAAAALTAIALPLSLHYWFRTGNQKLMGYVFYGLHFVIVVINLILDGALISDGEAPAFVTDVYAVYVLPGYIAFYGAFWSVLWFLDEQSKRLEKKIEMSETEEAGVIDRRIAVAEAKSIAISQAFRSKGAQRAINTWAAKNAPKLLAEELGITVDELGGDEEYTFWDEDDETMQDVIEPISNIFILKWIDQDNKSRTSRLSSSQFRKAQKRCVDLAVEGCKNVQVLDDEWQRVWPKAGPLNPTITEPTPNGSDPN